MHELNLNLNQNTKDAAIGVLNTTGLEGIN